MTPSPFHRWLLGGFLVLLLVAAPWLYYRQSYRHSKRLRVVTPGKMYRSGSMTAEGFRDAIRRFGIKTVLNLQNEAHDPSLPQGFFDRSTIRESAVCSEMGVQMNFLEVGLVPPQQMAKERPTSIDRFLALMDDPGNYPVLIHCRAGLHRTGVITALYRMEYEGWSREDALRELKSHGFGEFASSSANLYIHQYVLSYHPRQIRGNSPRSPTSIVPGRLTSQPAEAKPEN